MHDTAVGRASVRRTFFQLVFGNNKGIMALWFRSSDSTGRHFHRYYEYPEQIDTALDTIEEFYLQHDTYYCPQLLRSKKLNKVNVETCPVIWADLDTCEPELLKLKPTVTVESSPGKYHATWTLDEPLPPEIASQLSKRIAYFHADDGCDKSGWDLSQLLRVPATFNFKYAGPEQPEVKIIDVNKGRFRPDDFDVYPPVKTEAYEEFPIPDTFIEETAEHIIERYKYKIQGPVWDLFSTIPQDKMVNGQLKSMWSEALWRLMRLCFEAGMTREEVFKVSDQSACNKFERDGRGIEPLWKDVCRAWGANEKASNPIAQEAELEGLLTDEERSRVENVETFVERYIKWASSLGDAASQYHQAGGFIILSGLLAGRVLLPTSFGTVKPNLWFMILADTTLTRKSTAMDLAIDFLAEVEEEAVMATDGSLEGLLQALSMRTGMPSIFLRDEFSGLLDSMNKKDYYAGMAEMLTRLYDGKLSKRLLKKESIEVRDPILITFAGGIKNRVQQLLTLDHISSGFIPRFVFITAVSDVNKVQPLGPPTLLDLSEKESLLQELIDMRTYYSQTVEYVPPTGRPIQMPRKWEADLTPEAWKRYNQFERLMLDEGVKSERADLMTPFYARLSVSTLKATLLLAASRQRSDKILVGLDDVLLGIKYCEGWRKYAIEVINGIGKTVVENQIERIRDNIKRNPGISRSVLMQHYHLTAREADVIFATLEQRGVVTSSRAGRGVTYYAVR